MFEIPDTKMESHGVNAVLVDEEAVGLVDETGCGAYILYGDGELDRFLAKRTLKHFVWAKHDSPPRGYRGKGYLYQIVWSHPMNPLIGIEMPPRMQTASRGIRGFNALDDTMKGPRASFFRNDRRGGLRGRIVGPQSSQNSNERRVGTSFGDTGGDYPEEPTATLEEIVAGLRGLTQEFAEFRKQRVYQSNETMGSSFEDSDYQPYREIDRGNVMVTLGDFMILKLPSFLGTKSTKDPQVFLDEMDKICTALGCSSLQVVELTGFRLTEVVQIWFATLKRCKPPSSAPFTWEEFTQAFMDRFLPESVRDAKTQEFETLMQALGMTVSDYDIQFTQLSRYALYLVQTEKERIKRFIKGLHEPIYKILVSQRFQSYPEVVDAARKLEARRKEVGAERERSKRNRGEGSSKYRDPSRGKDANIVGQQGRRDEFAYNNSYQVSIKMAPFEALYGQKCSEQITLIKVQRLCLKIGIRSTSTPRTKVRKLIREPCEVSIGIRVKNVCRGFAAVVMGLMESFGS
ncbi:Uncharacterized protein TCM_027124 [Theobroma cacao]|uniref:Retrotransposon gag domain-containing protein n=1 Tax=Theobroma cacao TaxID=3641 RepID=A0A061G7D6_THECC|nr:Uncharacterized protein TCM_027124 [Theobroma cacao]